MQLIERFDFVPLTFDDRGALTSKKDFNALLDRVASPAVTDAIVIAHGFRNDARDATTLYTHFLQTLRSNLDRPEFASVAARGFVVAGVYWPSKPFREAFGDDGVEEGTRGIRREADAMALAKAELADLRRAASPAKRKKLDKAKQLLPKLEGNAKAQDEFVALVLSLLDRAAPDKTEGLPQIKKRSGSELLNRLADPNGARGLGDAFGTIAGRVGQFLNLTTWYVMKDRSGTVGETGVAKAVRALRRARGDLKIHLVGHSLGGRLMASCAKSLADAPKLRPDSLVLLEAAFSHYGFSADNGRGAKGFFRNVVTKKVVKGPFVSTFSAQDTVVGKAYSVMSRLALDNTREIGDASDEFGGIGRNGPLKTEEVVTSHLHAPGTPYDYALDSINNLDGSGGLITNHSDVTNPAVTYAVASALART